MKSIAMIFVLFSVMFQGADVFAEMINSRNQDVPYQASDLSRLQSLQETNTVLNEPSEKILVHFQKEPLYSSEILPKETQNEPKECRPPSFESDSDFFSFLKDLPDATTT